LEPGAEPRDLTLVVKLDEGRPYQWGRVSWEGNSVLPTATLEKQWPKKGGPLYSATRVQRAQAGAYGEYSERGYLYVNIEPQETVRADSVVDVAFGITENSPSHVRRIGITGNKGTREKVIRREINIHEGDLFRRSALIRSRDDVMRLGIFNDLTPDFPPRDRTHPTLAFPLT